MDTFTDTFKKKDHLYVETTAFHESEDIIENFHRAVIAGRASDGKTSMAIHLMLKYTKRGYDAVYLTCAQDWKTFVVGEQTENQKQYVLIDDMFGSAYVGQTEVGEWIALLEIIERLIKEKNGKLCQGSPGVGRNTFLSSPLLCFIIVFICDLFVSRDDPLMS